jgi:prevent-host-death family protein
VTFVLKNHIIARSLSFRVIVLAYFSYFPYILARLARLARLISGENQMRKEWLLSEAKNKFTEVVNMALIAPQTIKRRKETVVLISAEEYNRLRQSDPFCASFPENKNFLQSMVGKSTVNMSTDEIMKLTRD